MRVSIGIIALNEEECLLDILNDITNQTYSQMQMEILLVDSGSTDNTKNIMLDFADKYGKKFYRIKVLDNPEKRQANGWNVVLKNYLGEVLIRIDAHAHIPIDFVEKRVQCLLNGEYVCGGRCPAMCTNDKIHTHILLAAENAMLGSSISKFRNSSVSCYVNSISHGAYRREVFDKVGYFNENLGRTEDNDIHQRIRDAGYKIFFDKNMVSYRYVRPTLKKILKQKFMNGYWIGKTIYINPACISMYYFVPLIFIVSLLISIILLINGFLLIFEIIAVSYGFAMLLSAIVAIKENKWNLRFIGIIPVCFLMHIFYGLGTLKGLLKL